MTAPSAIDWDSIPDLLTAPVAELAARLGVKVTTVSGARYRRAHREWKARKDQERAVAGLARPVATHTLDPAPTAAPFDDYARERGVIAAIADLDPDARARVLAYCTALWPTTQIAAENEGVPRAGDRA